MRVHTTARQHFLAMTLLFLVAFAFASQKASADILLAGFENNLNSPYVDAETSAPIAWGLLAGTNVYSTTTGVTEGTSSLEITSPVDWNETLLLSSEQVIADLSAGTVLAMDVNVPAGSGGVDDWISFQFWVNGDTQGWLSSPSLYDGHATGDGTVTVTWDYSALALNATDTWYDLGLIINPGEARTLFIDNLRVLTANDPGDFDSDGDVDGADLLEWQRTDGSAAGLTAWQSGYPGAVGASAGISAVPEPASIGLLSLAMLLISSQRRRNLA